MYDEIKCTLKCKLNINMLTKELIIKATKEKDLKSVVEVRISDAKICSFDELDELIKLRDLDLSNNKIKDPAPLSCIKELRSLNLSTNLISTVPIMKFAYLQRLNLAYNSLTTTKNLSHLKKLTYLNLNSNYRFRFIMSLISK